MPPTLKRYRRLAVGSLAALAVTVVAAPEALAFPYHATVGGNAIYSDRPIPPAIDGVVARADALIAASPLAGPGYGHRIFLTDGGWRWRVLSFGTSGAFALTRPLGEAIIVNDADVAADRVRRSDAAPHETSLARVIAHERTHGLIRARYGILTDITAPGWKREGYCDYVAGGSTVSDAGAAAMRHDHRTSGSLDYYLARERVAAALRANGGSVDKLFAS